MASAAVKSLALRVNARVGFDPMILIAIFQAFMELLKNCKKPASKAEALALIDGEHATMNGDDDDELKVHHKRDKAHRTPMLFRMACRQNGVRDRDDHDALYPVYVEETHADREKLAAALVA